MTHSKKTLGTFQWKAICMESNYLFFSSLEFTICNRVFVKIVLAFELKIIKFMILLIEDGKTTTKSFS